MKKRQVEMLTAREVAARLGAGESSIRVWAREGRFPGAALVKSPVGSYWLIPDTALAGFVKRERGRPPKAGGEKAGKKGRKK